MIQILQRIQSRLGPATDIRRGRTESADTPTGLTSETAPPKEKTVFVIMPFEESPTRKRPQLDTFFESDLKDYIEKSTDLKHKHRVSRSDDTFEITPHIIKSLYLADIVIADLSGERANPNVMYELGVRLSVSHRPVILIREEHKINKRIFDTQDYYIYPYDPLRYPELQLHILKKLQAFEAPDFRFRSPVLRTLELESSVVERIEIRRLSRLLQIFHASLQGIHEVLLFNMIDQCKRKQVDLVPPDPTKTPDDELAYRFLTSNETALKSIGWDTWEFLAYVPPAMQEYLSGESPEQLLPHPEGIRLNTFVLLIWTHFFATSSAWKPSELTKLIVFAHETLWLMRALMAASLWLENAGPKDREHSQVMLKQAIDMSRMVAVHEGRATMGGPERKAD